MNIFNSQNPLKSGSTFWLSETWEVRFVTRSKFFRSIRRVYPFPGKYTSFSKLQKKKTFHLALSISDDAYSITGKLVFSRIENALNCLL